MSFHIGPELKQRLDDLDRVRDEQRQSNLVHFGSGVCVGVAFTLAAVVGLLLWGLVS